MEGKTWLDEGPELPTDQTPHLGGHFPNQHASRLAARPQNHLTRKLQLGFSLLRCPVTTSYFSLLPLYSFYLRKTD